jgi:hypothetical protein
VKPPEPVPNQKCLSRTEERIAGSIKEQTILMNPDLMIFHLRGIRIPIAENREDCRVIRIPTTSKVSPIASEKSHQVKTLSQIMKNLSNPAGFRESRIAKILLGMKG